MNIVGWSGIAMRCWLNFRCRGVLLIRLTVGQCATALAVGVGGGCLDIISFFFLSGLNSIYSKNDINMLYKEYMG